MLEAGFCEPLIILSGVKDSSKGNWNYSPGVIIISSHLSGLVLTPLETEPRPRCTSLVYQGRVKRVQKWKLSRHDWILHLQCSIFCDFSKSLYPQGLSFFDCEMGIITNISRDSWLNSRYICEKWVLSECWLSFPFSHHFWVKSFCSHPV